MMRVRKLPPDFFQFQPLADLMDPAAVAKRDHLTADLLDALTRDTHDVRVPRRDFWIGVLQKVRTHRIEHDEGGGDGLVPAGHALRERHHHELEGGEPAVNADGGFGLNVKFLAHDFFSFTPVFTLSEARRRRSGESGGGEA